MRAGRVAKRLRSMVGFAVLSCGVHSGPDDSSPDQPAGAGGDSGDQLDPGWTHFEGGLHYVSRLDGVVRCDARVELNGTPYTGECRDCDWAFSIEATIAEDGGLDGCRMAPQFSLVESEDLRGLRMAFASDRASDDWWTVEPAEDVLLSGYDTWADGVYGASDWFEIASSESDWGQARVQDGAVFWEVDLEAEIRTERFSEMCADYMEFNQYEAMGGDWVGESELDCAGETIDVWSFETDRPDTIRVTVDTVATDTAFDPAIWLQGPDECVLMGADDSVDCTHPPLDYRCPTLLLEEAPVGEYQLVIVSMGSCTGLTAAYQLHLGAPDVSGILLSEDDADRVLRGLWELEIDGEGVLSSSR